MISALDQKRFCLTWCEGILPEESCFWQHDAIGSALNKQHRTGIILGEFRSIDCRCLLEKCLSQPDWTRLH